MGPQHHRCTNGTFQSNRPTSSSIVPSRNSARGRTSCEVKTAQLLSGTANQAAGNYRTPSPKVTSSGSRPTKGMVIKQEYQRRVMKAETPRKKKQRHETKFQCKLTRSGHPRKQRKANQDPFGGTEPLGVKVGVELWWWDLKRTTPEMRPQKHFEKLVGTALPSANLAWTLNEPTLCERKTSWCLSQTVSMLNEMCCWQNICEHDVKSTVQHIYL